ncbi:hypothetical protein M0812_01199 [Anaeramoeba flamelloides]|uniref:Uncharacterized protein n=1 Tax=Anaeramoeba flamelloides TaxID=1746091 RepID=A0AAV8A5N0_9EUKA|nr:hypothetical protein M0812_01199 [Anaeramoeba flamelloides]
MKIEAILIFFLLSCIVFGCDNDKQCEEKDAGRCYSVTKKCVECLVNQDCPSDKYCFLDGDNYRCREYSQDDVLGQFCNYDIPETENNCTFVDTNYVMCGKCVEDSEDFQWKGVCIDWECYPCRYGEDESGILEGRPNYSCFPRGSSGITGKVGAVQFNDSSPSSLSNDGLSIGLMFCGIFMFLILVLQCVYYFKIGS